MILERLKTVLVSELWGEDQAAFEGFVSQSPFAAYQQSRAWAGNVPRSKRQDYLFFLCRDGGELIGAGVVRRSRLGPGAWLATLQRGPVVHDLERLGFVLDSLKNALRSAGCSTLVLGPRIGGGARAAAVQALRAAGFAQLPSAQQPLHVATGRVDLAPDEAAIFASFKQRGRRQVRAATKQGVAVRPALTADDLRAFQAVSDAFHQSKPGYETHGLPDVSAQAEIIRASGGAMLLAELGDQVIGGHAFVIQGRDAIWLSLATSAENPSIPRSYLLLWEGMRLARKLGCRHYDLAGLSEDEAADGGEASRDQFKYAFAPTFERLVPAHVAALRPVRHRLFFTARQLYRRTRRGLGRQGA